LAIHPKQPDQYKGTKISASDILSLQGDVETFCPYTPKLRMEDGYSSKWIGNKNIMHLHSSSFYGGLPCRFSTRTYGYVGQFLHRLMIEAANLKYLPALENAKLSEAGFGLSQKSNKTLYHKYLLMTYNTFGIGATSVCTYYDHSGIMPYNIKTMRPWPWPCDSHRNSEEALKLMGRYVPCQQNLEQGPQYILKAIEMVEARYPAEH
jgi:hypothetical protein